MTAANNIRYYKTNMCRYGRSASAMGIASKAIGAVDYTFFSFVRRLIELRSVTRPTVVEINGIEADYATNKAKIDLLFKFLSSFSKHHRLVKFAVKIGNRRYVL